MSPSEPSVEKFDTKPFGLVRGGGELFSEVSNKSENCLKLGLLKVPVAGILMKFPSGMTYSRTLRYLGSRVFKVECAIICVHGPAVHPLCVYIPRCIIHARYVHMSLDVLLRDTVT